MKLSDKIARLRDAGITDPDELKHTLEDHARWFVNAHLAPPETPQEDAAPPVDLAVVIVERVVAGVRLGVPRSQTIRAVVEILKQQPPSLLAASEGRVRGLLESILADASAYQWHTAIRNIFALAPLAEPGRPQE